MSIAINLYVLLGTESRSLNRGKTELASLGTFDSLRVPVLKRNCTGKVKKSKR